MLKAGYQILVTRKCKLRLRIDVTVTVAKVFVK